MKKNILLGLAILLAAIGCAPRELPVYRMCPGIEGAACPPTDPAK